MTRFFLLSLRLKKQGNERSGKSGYRHRPKNSQPVLGHTKTGLGFHALVKQISDVFLSIPDKRQQKKIRYSIRDGLMSGLAMMYFQDPSLLRFQKRMEEDYNTSNLKALFEVANIPADTQMRKIIDNVPPEKIEEIFQNFFRILQRGKQLEKFLFAYGRYLVAIDGTEFFSSEKISCPNCLHKKSKTGNLRCHHQVVQAVLIHPDMRQVIPLASEAIRNEDGAEKQDCELNAAKRLIGKIRTQHPKLKLLIVGDGLFSKQSFIEVLLDKNMSFTLVAKPDDHKIMFRSITNRDALDKVNEIEIVDDKNNLHTYRWSNQVNLNGNKDILNVNFFEYEMFNQQLDKVTYRNSWVTDIIVGPDNVKLLVRGGRARWKVENETFNTLKNQGYNIEHNFGHGSGNLCRNFYLLNLIAFFIHQIFELTDTAYQQVRAKIGTRKEFFNNLRSFMRVPGYKDWYHFLATVYHPASHLTATP